MECHGKLENFHQVRTEWNWKKPSSELFHVLFSTANSEAMMELDEDNTATKHSSPTCRVRGSRFERRCNLLLLLAPLLRHFVDLITSSSSSPLPAMLRLWATAGAEVHMAPDAVGRMLDRFLTYIPDRMPERLPLRMLGHMFDRMPESMPIYYAQ